MSVEVWQNLPKAQDDDETIEQAIDRKINAHLADVNAHLGDNESLQSHRASEIIDHLAQSIVNDKILDYQVSPQKLLLDRIHYDTTFADYDKWTKQQNNGVFYNRLGSVGLECSAGSSNYARLYAFNSECIARTPTYDWVWQAQLRIESMGVNGIDSFGVGHTGFTFIGFQCINNVLFAQYRVSGSVVAQLEISAIDPYYYHTYKIINNHQVGALFVVDDNLVAELNFMENYDQSNFCFFEVKETVGDIHQMNITRFTFFQHYF